MVSPPLLATGTEIFIESKPVAPSVPAVRYHGVSQFHDESHTGILAVVVGSSVGDCIIKEAHPHLAAVVEIVQNSMIARAQD